MLDGLRRMVERLLPWYDPERQAERDRRIAERIQRADAVAARAESKLPRADLASRYRRADGALRR